MKSFSQFLNESPIDDKGNIIAAKGDAEKTEKLIDNLKSNNNDKKKDKKPLKGKNVKPGETTGTPTPKRGATAFSQTGQRNLFTGEVEPPKEVKVRTTYNTGTKKNTTPKTNTNQTNINFTPKTTPPKTTTPPPKPQSNLERRMSNAANKNAALIRNKQGFKTPKVVKQAEVSKKIATTPKVATPKVVKQAEVSKKIANTIVKTPKPKTTNITPEMKARTFNQSFGKPTGADPKTGKATYIPPKNIVNRNLYVDPQGKVTERGINNYISNRNTKGKFKGAKIDKETVNKGLEQTKKDIKDPNIRKSTADQIKTKYGGRRAERAVTPDPTKNKTSTPPKVVKQAEVSANMKRKTSTPKIRKSIVDLQLPKDEIIGGPRGAADRIKVSKPKLPATITRNRKNFKSFELTTRDAMKTINKGNLKFDAISKPVKVKPSTSNKPPKLPYQRFDNREPFMDDDLGQRTGKTGDKLVNKQPTLSRDIKRDIKKNQEIIRQVSNPQRTAGGKPITTSVSGIEKSLDKTPEVKMGKPSEAQKKMAKMTAFPKVGKKTGSTIVSRSFGRTTGGLFGISSGIEKYKQERAKYPQKSKLSAVVKGSLKGSASAAGAYAGAQLGRKLGPAGMYAGSLIGSALGKKGYEIGNNIKNYVGKTYKDFRKGSTKTNNNTPKVPSKPPEIKRLGISS